MVAPEPLRVLTVDKGDWAQRKFYELPTGFLFHLGNAREEAGGTIHLDWAIGTALDLTTNATMLSIFDALNLAAGPIVQARLPYALPLGFHGTFAVG